MKEKLKGAAIAIYAALLVVLVLGIIAWQITLTVACSAQHGVVVNNAWNWPVCIEKGQHP